MIADLMPRCRNLTSDPGMTFDIHSTLKERCHDIVSSKEIKERGRRLARPIVKRKRHRSPLPVAMAQR